SDREAVAIHRARFDGRHPLGLCRQLLLQHRFALRRFGLRPLALVLAALAFDLLLAALLGLLALPLLFRFFAPALRLPLRGLAPALLLGRDPLALAFRFLALLALGRFPLQPLPLGLLLGTDARLLRFELPLPFRFQLALADLFGRRPRRRARLLRHELRPAGQRRPRALSRQID